MFVFVVTFAWAIFSYRKPAQAVLWFPLLLPLYVLRTHIGIVPTTALELVFIVTALIVTVRLGPRIWREGFHQAKPWHLASALWIFATLVAIFISPHVLSAVGLWRAYVLEPILYAVLLSGFLHTEEDRMHVLSAFALAVAWITGIAVIQFLTGHGIPYPWNTTDLWTRRATGPFPFPNALALFSAPIAAVCFAVLFNTKYKKTRTASCRQTTLVCIWIGLIAGMCATLLAKSVGGAIGILAAIFFALIRKTRTRRMALIICMTLLLIVGAVPAFRQTVISTLTFQKWSGKVRTIMWKETLAMLKDRPVFGAGFGAYPERIKPYHQATYIEIFQYPHNLLLNLWSETGLLGVMAFAWIVITWFRQATAKNRRQIIDSKQQPSIESSTSYCLPSAVYCLPLITILVHGFVDVPYFKNDLAFMFWGLAALNTYTSTTSS